MASWHFGGPGCSETPLTEDHPPFPGLRLGEEAGTLLHDCLAPEILNAFQCLAPEHAGHRQLLTVLYLERARERGSRRYSNYLFISRNALAEGTVA